MLSPIIEKGFERILSDFSPKHKIAFLSLCTKTRPYNKSLKWKKFIQKFGNDCDLIVCSNGGVIPQQYWECYPYLTYDAPHTGHKYDELYIQILYDRLCKFFNKFHYDTIIFNFRPTLRNRISAEKFKENYKGDSEIYIIPTKEAWENLKDRWHKENRKGGFYFPDLEPEVISELDKVLLDNR